MACMKKKLIETTMKDIGATFCNLINLRSCFYSKYTNGMHDASLPSRSHFLLLEETTFPGLVETECLLAPVGEAGKESLFFRGAEAAAFSGVVFLCDALLPLDDGFAFATWVDGEELEWISSSFSGDTPMLCLRLFSWTLLNMDFESASPPHEPVDTFGLVPFDSEALPVLFGGDSMLPVRVAFLVADGDFTSLFWSRREYSFVISPTDMVFFAALFADA